MNKKKTIIAAIVLLLVLLVGGAIAYFTDKDTAENVFTIGKVKITLSEPNWDETKAENMMPKQTVKKDPVVINDKTTKGSTSPAYVFVKVEVPCYTTAASTTETPSETLDLFTYTVNSDWTLLNSKACTSSSEKSEYVYYYGESGSLTELAVGATTTSAVFDEVTLANLDGSETLPSDVKMPVTAYGIQTEGVEASDPTAAFANFS